MKNIMSGPAEGVLVEAIGLMLVNYLPTHNTNAVCEISRAFNSDPNQPLCNSGMWTPEYSKQAAEKCMTLITSQDSAINLLTLVGSYGIATDYSVAMRTCSDDLNFTDRQYAYLWYGPPYPNPGPFCQVLTNGTINYTPIARISKLVLDSTASKALPVITTAYQNIITQIDVKTMTSACSTALHYKDMSQPPLLEICGCYMDISNDTSFNSTERESIAAAPECLPSCLSAAVRYVRGGNPTPCQQNLCIADNINVTGATTRISQVCTQCPKLFECVCYIHVNGQQLDNSTCNTIYDVDDKGNITSTSHNIAPAAGSGIKRGFESALRSPAALYGLIAVAVLIVIGVFVILLIQHMRGQKISNPPTGQLIILRSPIR